MIDCSKIDCVDFTAAKAVKVMLEDFRERNQAVVWMNIAERVENTLNSVCKIETIKNIQDLRSVQAGAEHHQVQTQL